MDKIAALLKEIEDLKIQRQIAEETIKMVNEKSELDYAEIAKSYYEFYANKKNKEFVLYDRFPSLSALDIYASRMGNFPLYEYGNLNIKELAEIIKHLYQFKTGKEYSILTIGLCEKVFKEQILFSYKPHLYLMVGDNKTLRPYEEFDGKFASSNKLCYSIKEKGQNFINIDADGAYMRIVDIRTYKNNDSGEFSLTPEAICKRQSQMKMLDDNFYKRMILGISIEKQIFTNNIKSSLNYSGGYKIKGIKDVMSFNVHPSDSYIAKILISIIIYKRNNHIKELSSDDYNHIFDVLFKEKVDIIGDTLKDIPKELIYIPDKNKY